MIDLPTLNHYASQVAGTPVTISCDPDSTFEPGVQAYVVWINGAPVPTIHLRRAICTELEHVDTGDIIPADFLYLEHEAQHIAMRSKNECDVERSALANAWGLIRQFHLPAWRTRAILAGLPYADAHLLPIYHQECTA